MVSIGQTIRCSGQHEFTVDQALISSGAVTIYPNRVPLQAVDEQLNYTSTELRKTAASRGINVNNMNDQEIRFLMENLFNTMDNSIDPIPHAIAGAGTAVFNSNYFETLTRLGDGLKARPMAAGERTAFKNSVGQSFPLQEGDIVVDGVEVYGGHAVHGARASQPGYTSFSDGFQGTALRLTAHDSNLVVGGTPSPESTSAEARDAAKYGRDTDRTTDGIVSALDKLDKFPPNQVDGLRLEATLYFGSGVQLHEAATMGLRAIEYVLNQGDVQVVSEKITKNAVWL